MKCQNQEDPNVLCHLKLERMQAYAETTAELECGARVRSNLVALVRTLHLF